MTKLDIARGFATPAVCANPPQGFDRTARIRHSAVNVAPCEGSIVPRTCWRAFVLSLCPTPAASFPYRPLVPTTGDVHFMFLPTALTLHKLGCGFGSSSIKQTALPEWYILPRAFVGTSDVELGYRVSRRQIKGEDARTAVR